MALGILAVILGTTIHRSRDVLFFLTAPMFAVVYQAMLLLSCRPLDTVGVRLVGLIIGLEFLYTTLGTEMHEAELLWTDGVECAGLRYAFLAARAVWGGAFAAACVAAAWSCSSRRALGRLWITMRIACPTALLLPTTHPGLRLFWGDCAVTADAGTQYPLAGVTGTLIWSVTGTVVFTLLLTERNRGRLAHWIAGAGLPEESRKLAAVGTLLGATYCNPVDQLVDEAVELFTVLPFSLLTVDVLRPTWTNADYAVMRPKLRTCDVGECDAFVSHAWADDAEEKYEAIAAWAASFERRWGREPLLFLDKCCVDQQDVRRSLRGLPVYIGGSRELLCCVGPTYCSRLWCILELFCFLTLRGSTDAITILRTGSMRRSSGASELEAADNILGPQLSTFRLSEATCSLATDQDRILSTIEAAFGLQEAFNKVVRELFDLGPERSANLHLKKAQRVSRGWSQRIPLLPTRSYSDRTITHTEDGGEEADGAGEGGVLARLTSLMRQLTTASEAEGGGLGGGASSLV